jgi:hypothetical protein
VTGKKLAVVMAKGKTRMRKVLCRSYAMEVIMRREAKKVVDDHGNATAQYDGIIYIMHIDSPNGVVVSRYIGKSETVGKTSGILSVNLSRLETDKSKFGRWGDNYAYHIGDLSSALLPGHEIAVQPLKYQHWAQALFEGIKVERPRLRQPVFLWVKAWRKDEIGGLAGIRADPIELFGVFADRARQCPVPSRNLESRRTQPGY